ncbi:hypothetical protein ASPCAL05715 [Aspergillus calidoustus]|uniref:Zn(2)-C6 fungal-type domain-containing protein n=1 Tax=Aspergillus calidoustus TaxID=454130 RepID=A0A0U5FYH5_ASPCI|nr:hypothetical protein ASPCAL05715 [Aspergillus calidoustus]
MSSRACDTCRKRKVRCDGVDSSPTENPCFHCRMSGTACQYEQTPKKRGPKSKRSDASDRLRRTRPSLLSNDHDASPLSGTASPLPLATSPTYEGQMLAWELRVSARTTDLIVSPSLETAVLNARIETIHQDLVRSIEAIDVKNTSWSLDATVKRCIDIYMNVIFGIRPIVSEARIRSNLCLKPPNLRTNLNSLRFLSRTMLSSDTLVDLERIRSYTLVTALCAATAYLLSASDAPEEAVVGPMFLHASREMLHIYEHLDVECPDSSSLVIRMFQAGALHTDGKLRLSWHLFGAALRLGEQMQLEDPRSFQGMDPLEARLRVMAFRTIRISARYHRILENHPLSICDPPWSALGSLDDEPKISLMMSSSSWDKPPEYESQLLVAFELFERIWVVASEILMDLECFVRFDRRDTSVLSTLLESHQNHFLDPYSTFLGLLDQLPPFLHSPESVKHIRHLDETVTEIQCRQFWIQRANLFVNYHCLRMLILNRFAQYGLTTMIGVQKTDTMVALRKTEIAHDMNVFLTNAPIDSLLVNGEACVAKIRYMGATLLEVIHQVQAPQVVKRAHSLFSSLLDILTKLDSRASDELISKNHNASIL